MTRIKEAKEVMKETKCAFDEIMCFLHPRTILPPPIKSVTTSNNHARPA